VSGVLLATRFVKVARAQFFAEQMKRYGLSRLILADAMLPSGTLNPREAAVLSAVLAVEGE
jgi:hypothetical protein